MQGVRFWHRFEIRQIEDLANAVLGADLEAIQMAGPPVRGSLIFAARNGVLFSSGLIQGKVAISGPLSQDAVTLGVGLRFGPGSRHWLNTVNDGDVGVFMPGDEHDAFYTEGSLYITATLSRERLEEEAARDGLALAPTLMSGTGLHSRPLAPRMLARLRSQVASIHVDGNANSDRQDEVGCAMLRTIFEHYARVPRSGDGRIHPLGRARIVVRARDFIRANLDRPITLNSLAGAAGTSRRSLSRAFVEVLQDTPGNYVRRLRLHRIRRDLASETEARCTVSMIAAKWGIGEAGRMSGWYRELFGEHPTETRARQAVRHRLNTLLL